MVDIRFRGSPHILTGSAHPPVAMNANGRRPSALDAGVPDFPIPGLLWAPMPASWGPMRPESGRHHLVVVK